MHYGPVKGCAASEEGSGGQRTRPQRESVGVAGDVSSSEKVISPTIYIMSFQRLQDIKLWHGMLEKRRGRAKLFLWFWYK